MQINQNLMRQNHTPLRRSNSQFQWIVIHHANKLEDARELTDYYKKNDVGASADFWVGFAGDIWQGNDYRNFYSWSIGGGVQGDGPHPYLQVALNTNSVSIEMCVHKRNQDTMNDTDKDWYFEDATVESAAWLTAHLMEELNVDIDHVIRNYDVNAKICPNPFVYDNDKTTWAGFKDKVVRYLDGGNGSPDITYYVQAGAYKDKATANEQAILMKILGFKVDVAFTDDLYKIEAGAFKDKDKADALCEKLKKTGFTAVITTG